MMSGNAPIPALLKKVVLCFALACLPSIAPGQLDTGSPPVADPSDTRFRGVVEDLTTPALATSSLRPVPPLIGLVAKHDTYTLELVRLQWRWGDPIDLYVIRPAGVTKPAVILYLYGYPSDTAIFKDERFQKMATADGFAAVGFVSALTGHRYHDRPMQEWFVSELQECLARTAHDIQLVLNYLESRGDLDMDRVGLFAQLSGASIGILASSADPRIKVLDALDPWGDWPGWMAASPFVPEGERADYVKPEFLAKLAPLEPVSRLPGVQARKFRLQQRAYEIATPAASKEKLRAAVPGASTVVVYKTRDEFNRAAGDDGSKNLEWMHRELRGLSKAATPGAAGLPERAPPSSSKWK